MILNFVPQERLFFKVQIQGARGMAQQLKVIAATHDDLRSNPRTQRVKEN